MSTTAAEIGSSLVRVSVLWRGRRADVAVPGAVPVCDLLPELAGAVSALDPYAVHGGYRLVRADGTVLQSESGLTSQGVDDGAQLTLEAGIGDTTERVYDDVVEAVADAVEQQARPWDDAASRRTALAASALLLTVAAFALGLERDMGLPVAVAAGGLTLLLLAAAAVLARARDEPQAAAVTAWCAAPFAAVAGFAALPDEPVLRLPLALAGAGVLLAGAVGGGLLRTWRSALLPAVVVGLAAAITGTVLETSSFAAAKVVAFVLTGAVLLGALVPLVAVSATRVRAPEPRSDADLLTDPEPIDPEHVAERVQLGRELLVGLAVATGLLVVLSAAFVVRLGIPGLLLGIVCCAVVLLRTRDYRARLDVGVGMTCGVAGLVAVIVAAAVVRPQWREALAGALVVVGGVLLAAAVAPRRASVRLGRAADVAEGVALVSLLPLLMLATGVLDAVRS